MRSCAPPKSITPQGVSGSHSAPILPHSPEEFFHRIGEIVGDDLSDGKVDLHISWNDSEEARTVLHRMRTIQRELRILKRSLNSVMSEIRSEFATAKSSVGKSFAAGVASGILGKQTVGRMNAARKDDLRREQFNALVPYQKIKDLIDRLISQFDDFKGQVELSPEYLNRAQGNRPPPAPSSTEDLRYYFHINGAVRGPFTREQIRALRDTGTIGQETLGCLEGNQTWHPLAELNLLSGA